MWFKRMMLEDWFDTHQYEIEYDVGESAVKYLTFEELGVDLNKVPLRYGYHSGLPELRQAIAEQYDGVSAEQVIVTTGASEANFATVASLVRPGDHVVVEHPNYPSLYEVPRSLGCKVTLFTLQANQAFQPDLAELERLITPDTKLISLTHPNNPTGSMISEATLQQAIRLAESNDTYLLFDETYRELAFAERLPGAASLSPKVISISSMSKSYGLPGIRIGWLTTQDPEILQSVLAIREQVTITNGALSEAIALSVLKRKDEFIEKAKRHVQNNLQIVRSWMKHQENVVWIAPEAGVVALPWITGSQIEDPEDVYRRLAKTYRSFVIPGRCFELDNHFFRLGYGGTAEELQAGLDNIHRALEDVKR